MDKTGFLDAALRHLYVAVGDPGAIDVFDTEMMRHLDSLPTRRGAHTLRFDAVRGCLELRVEPSPLRVCVVRGL